jgi:hypothetical protein
MNQILKTQTLALIFFCFLVGSISFKLNQAQTIYQTPQVIINIITAGNGGNSSYPQNASLAPNAYYAPIQFPVPTTGQPSSTPGAKYLNNIDYLSRSYDMFKGNPHFFTSTTDPGIGLRNILDLTYHNKTTTLDKRYFLPDGMNSIITDSCTLSTRTEFIVGEESYYKSLNMDVSVEEDVNFGIFSSSFKSSYDYAEISSNIYKKSNSYIYSYARCSVYSVNFDGYPKLNKNFANALNDLPLIYNSTTYSALLEKYGTHYFSYVVMGARYGYQFKMNSLDLANARSSNYSIGIKIGATGAIFGISVSTGFSEEESSGRKYYELVTEEKIVSVGSKPPADNKASTWAASAHDNPAPIQFTLRPIYELISAENLNTKNVSDIKNNIKTALEKDYCKYLLSLGKISDCNPPKPDLIVTPKVPTTPIIPNTCTLCRKQCGGKWTEDGGAVSLDQEWGHKFTIRNYGCQGDLGTFEFMKGEGVHLCCAKSIEKNPGSCKFCTTCAGEYMFYGGSLKNNESWENWNKIYPKFGIGEIPTVNSPGPINLCCKDAPICSLCHTCGGSYHSVQGQLLIGDTRSRFFHILKEGCEGPYSSYDYWKYDGGKSVSLCCKK